MFRMICICFFLFTPSLTAESSLEGALDALLNAPWEKGPSSLSDGAKWKIEPYTISNRGEGQGYNLRAFFRDSGFVRTKLFTYAEPSLSAFRETILMGYIQMEVQTEKEAGEYHGRMTGSLQSRGFENSPPDTSRQAVVFRNIYRNGVSFRKGELTGRVYSIKDYRTNRWYARTSISHSRFDEFWNTWMAEWHKGWISWYIPPDSLIQELEAVNISRTLTPSRWAMIKSIGESARNPLRKPNPALTGDLVSAFESVEKGAFPEKNRPAALLLKNYLARYLFFNGLMKEIAPEQKKWLETRGLRYTWSALGMGNHYNEALLVKLAAEYPDSYWGQFAFLDLMQMGFDTSGMCMNGHDQWMVVLKEGAAFLKKYSDSPFAPDIRFYLGKAAETLFNLGAVEDHPARDTSGETTSQYAGKRGEARKQAIRYYEEVLQSPQKGKYEHHLEYILPRLRGDFGTGCEYYFCFYD